MFLFVMSLLGNILNFYALGYFHWQSVLVRTQEVPKSPDIWRRGPASLWFCRGCCKLEGRELWHPRNQRQGSDQIYSEAFIIYAMPVAMMNWNVCGKASIGKVFIARRASILPGFHVSVPQMALHVIFPLNGLAADDTSISYITLLHLGCHQGFQLHFVI